MVQNINTDFARIPLGCRTGRNVRSGCLADTSSPVATQPLCGMNDKCARVSLESPFAATFAVDLLRVDFQAGLCFSMGLA